MLGISQSRAGAIVDCPGCGRSLRVPNPDGSVDPMPTGTLNSGETGSLIAALEQLSAIRLPAGVLPPGSASEPEHSAVELLRTESAVEVDSRHTVRKHIPGPAGRNTRSSWFIFAVCCLSLLTGVMLGCVLYPAVFARQRTETAVTERENQANQVTIEQRARGLAVQSEPADAHFGFVSGRITWRNSESAELPDAAALVLLLPSQHPGAMKLDGTSLREVQKNTDQQAIAAALLQFGGSFTRAETDGHFRLPRRSESEMQLIVVSRHRSRQDEEKLLPAIHEILNRYFVSPVPFTGRLMVVHQTIEAVPQNSTLRDLTISVLVP